MALKKLLFIDANIWLDFYRAEMRLVWGFSDTPKQSRIK
jgi:hypothetical protein